MPTWLSVEWVMLERGAESAASLSLVVQQQQMEHDVLQQQVTEQTKRADGAWPMAPKQSREHQTSQNPSLENHSPSFPTLPPH